MNRRTRANIVIAVLLLAVAAGWIWIVSNAVASVSPRHAPVPSPTPYIQGPPIPAARGVDLDVTYISRSPLYQAYCVDYAPAAPGKPGIPYLCPGTEDDRRWPELGEIVTFTAHVANKGTVGSPAFGYAWYIDRAEVAGGTLPPLAAGAEVTATYQWPWGHGLSPDGQRALGSHTVRFAVDPDSRIAETHESNNSVQDLTNAMSFRFTFTPEMYAAYTLREDPRWPASAEDWIQKQMAMMNWTFAHSTYPVAPEGATVRVRIDQIDIGATVPPVDGHHDGRWFIDEDYRYGASTRYDPAADIDWTLIHEMSHQVSVIDLYAIGAEGPDVRVTDRVGHPLTVGFSWPRPGLMGGGDIWPHTNAHLYASHGAAGVSTFEGYRNGYYGAYLFDIPLENALQVLDNQGEPAAGVQVALYQRSGTPDWTGAPAIDSTPEISGTTGADGLFLLPNRSALGGTVTANGHVLHDNPFGVVDVTGIEDLFLVLLRRGDHEETHWLDITTLNLAYWMGDTISHTVLIESHLPPPGAPLAPVLTGVQVQDDWIRLCWRDSLSPDVTRYRLYEATEPRYDYALVAEAAHGPCLEEISAAPSQGGKVYALTAVDGRGLESGFSNSAWAPTLTNPAALVISAEGQRTILDPRNGYALIRQDAGGAYRQYLGSVHYHLENSEYVTLDGRGRLLLSHPGDAYVSRHSVRVADMDGTPLLEFGSRGSAPGAFDTPAGVASWDAGCAAGEVGAAGAEAAPGDAAGAADGSRAGDGDACDRILVADSGNARVQAFDGLGQFVSAYGRSGSGAGQFTDPQGLVVDGQGRVLVVDRGNNRLVVLSFDGQTFGYSDSYAADLDAPTGVTVDSQDHIVVADTGNDRVVVLSPAGEFLVAYTSPNDGYTGAFEAPRGVAVAPDGTLVVADTGNRRVVTVRGALPGPREIRLPMVVRDR